MKKAGIVLLLIACGVGLVFFLQGTQEKRIEAADCLPADVLFYGEQLEFTEMYATFLESRLGKVLSNIDYKSIGIEVGAPEDALLKIDKSLQEIQSILGDPGFNILLGKEFSLAIFPANSFSVNNPAKEIEERLLLIARPRHNAKMLELLAPFISKDIEKSTAQYGKHSITRYKLDEQNSLSAVTVEGLIIAAFEERLVRKSLDYYDNQKDTLSSNKDYQRLRKDFKDTKIFTYLSLPALSKQGRLIGESLSEKDKDEFFTLLDEWNGWGSVAYGAWHEKGKVRDKVEILFDKTKLDSRVARLCEMKPEPNKTIQLVPADPLFYYWTNTLNLPLLWELYSSNAVRKQPEALDILRMELRDTAGIELEELLETIDSEFAMIVEDVDRRGIPLPKAAILVQLKDSVKFLKVFNILLQNADIPVSLKKYNDYEISYWGAVPQSGLQPAFTLIDNYLLISNSIDLIKQIVDLQTEPVKQLVTSEAMKEVGGDLLSDNNSVTYVHIAKFADAFKDLATWGGAMAVLQGPEMAKKADIVLNQLVLPLLDGVAMYTQLGARSYITEDSIVLESTTTVVQ